MAKATLTQRVEVLEHKVNELATLPARVGAVERELQEFRADVEAEFGKVHAEFGKVRSELGNVHAEFGKVHGELRNVHAEFGKVHGELRNVHAEFGKVHGELRNVHAEFGKVRTEIRQGDEETRRYMRVLYEDLVERVKIMGEGIEELRRRS